MSKIKGVFNEQSNYGQPYIETGTILTKSIRPVPLVSSVARSIYLSVAYRVILHMPIKILVRVLDERLGKSSRGEIVRAEAKAYNQGRLDERKLARQSKNKGGLI